MRRPIPALLGAWLLASLLAMPQAQAQTAPAQTSPAPVAEARPAHDDPALEARVMKLSAELRCLVCQNETIAGSNADLAVDLRNQVREMLRGGSSEAEVMTYMTDRYGDFVRYRPPLKASTVLLWFGPLLLLLIGAAVLVLTLRRRAQLGAEHFEPDDEDLAAAGTGPQPPQPGAAAQATQAEPGRSTRTPSVR